MQANIVSQKMSCQIANIKPNVENVIPYTVFKRTQPRTLQSPLHLADLSDQSILYGGGRDFILTLLNGQDGHSLECVELFILNSCIILWFNVLGHGLEVPYTSVMFHAVATHNGTAEEGHSIELVLTLERDTVLDQFFPVPPSELQAAAVAVSSNPGNISTVGIVLYPKYSMYERHYNSEIETLFTFMDFGMNRGDDLVKNCHNALAVGMDLHWDAFRDDDGIDKESVADEPAAAFSGISDFIQNTRFQNTGFADDLDTDADLSGFVNRDKTQASMTLRFQLENRISGRKNQRNL
ncbi:Lot5p KNAG_0D04500 [Huiozyma naganishii CBS 8797]|uniref:Protein LOT5 n=1 Tax=Huiozyma naganishii (strain ATCC MYA-139 / BCRC 22969 / CBS 8797 / KCTC 17520 / NBRC 10181 / NCYC 3082 / Yp74L-3) TaxID=1071383 RepID=J7R5R2_HUIN7|nr:hypothetical protein KNAG_0D04500 [Kazachstania naganishii CBS 8797]CCK70195.1 hypothetical protein KNAG_0D04500 [Kazachstania naganishii CBS 8797]